MTKKKISIDPASVDSEAAVDTAKIPGSRSSPRKPWTRLSSQYRFSTS